MASGSKQTQTVNQTTTQTPNVPSWLQNPAQGIAGNIERLGQMDASSFVTPATANQRTAFAQAPGLLNDMDLTRFMNPYTREVIDAGVSDLDRARRIAINGNSGAFTQGGGANAWLSDRAGVADAETNRGFLDQVASFSANQRQANFTNAQNQALAYNQNQRANLGFLSDLGAQERAIASENNPNVAALSQSQALAQLLASLNPALYTGQTSNTNGTTTARSNPGFLESIGTLAMGAGALGYNPFRVGK